MAKVGDIIFYRTVRDAAEGEIELPAIVTKVTGDAVEFVVFGDDKGDVYTDCPEGDASGMWRATATAKE